MNRLLTSLLFVPLLCCATQPAVTPVDEFTFTEHLRGKSLLFVGAHPDDELSVAPMFAEACLFNGAKCHFVVASEAKSLGCFLTIGLKNRDECSRLRREEMRRSASLLGGNVTFLGWQDLFYAFDRAGMERNLATWERDNGGHAALVARIVNVLNSVKPDVVFTIDPRHGVTCHPNHRVVARLLLEAIVQSETKKRPEVWLEADFLIDDKMDPATKAKLGKGAVFAWPAETAPLYWYDASKTLPNGKTGFDYLVSATKLHQTQYPDVASGERILAPPPELQRIPFIHSEDVDPTQDLCTVLALDRPTADKHEYPSD
jgi:LmbE family N-acetylglucosaminyl deacetylase